MGLKVTADFPDYEKGITMDLGGIAVENGGTTELSDDQEQRFAASHSAAVREYFKGSKNVKVEGNAAVPPSQVEGGEGN